MFQCVLVCNLPESCYAHCLCLNFRSEGKDVLMLPVCLGMKAVKILVEFLKPGRHDIRGAGETMVGSYMRSYTLGKFVRGLVCVRTKAHLAMPAPGCLNSELPARLAVLVELGANWVA